MADACMPDPLAREIQVLADLRQATSEAHKALRDLRNDMQAARELRRKFLAAPELDERLGELVKQGLADYEATLQQAIKTGEQAMYNRFDVLTAICLGEDPASVRAGETTLPDLLREFIATKGLPYKLAKIR